MRSRVPWTTKLRPELEPKVVPERRGRMLVPTPLLVAEEVRRVPRGRLITPGLLRERLAKRFRADLTCPMTTGIFLNILAGAAEEQLAGRRRPVAPYWRVVREDGTLSEKFPPGRACQAARLRQEGHVVKRERGRDKWRVSDFNASLLGR